jgi:hypothetical protein
MHAAFQCAARKVASRFQKLEPVRWLGIASGKLGSDVLLPTHCPHIDAYGVEPTSVFGLFQQFCWRFRLARQLPFTPLGTCSDRELDVEASFIAGG